MTLPYGGDIVARDAAHLGELRQRAWSEYDDLLCWKLAGLCGSLLAAAEREVERRRGVAADASAPAADA